MSIFGTNSKEIEAKFEELRARHERDRKNLEAEREALQQERSAFDRQRAEWQALQQQVSDERAKLNLREAEIVRREEEAAAGFPQREQESLRQIAAKKDDLLRKQTEFTLRERELEQAVRELAVRQEAVAGQEARQAKNEKELAAQIDAVRADRAELERRDLEFAQREQALAIGNQDLRRGQAEMEALRTRLESQRQAEEERRQEYERQRLAHDGELRKIEEATRHELDRRLGDLDAATKRFAAAEEQQRLWGDRLQAQQRELEAGLAPRRGELEKRWQEQMAGLEKQQRELDQQSARLTGREQAVREREVAAEEGFQRQREELERALGERRQETSNSLERAKAIEAELQVRIKATEQREQQLDKTIAQRSNELAAMQIAEANTRRESAIQRGQSLERLLAEREERVAKLEAIAFRIDGRDAGEILAEIDRLRRANAELTAQRDERPSLQQYQDMQSQVLDNEQLRQQVKHLRERESVLQQKVDSADLDAVSLSRKQERVLQDERFIEVLNKRIEQLTRELDRLIGERRNAVADEKKCQEAIRTPVEAFKREANEKTVDDIDEETWLGDILQNCSDSGFDFPPRLVKAFHTALKIHDWSPLTVLAGVSGTGKTQLPNLYARFGGLRFLNQSVQSNWDSPSSLLGYFNAIDNRFDATPLLQSLDQASRDPADGHGFNDRLLLVLLDEMNLAHVELYLSDFLSYWELKRGDDTGRTIDLGLGANVSEPYHLKVGDNVLWCGTMNQDETTKALSDKVIDRGGMLFFPRPRRLARREDLLLVKPGPALPLERWNSWYAEVKDQSKPVSDEITRLRGVIEEINDRLEDAGRALGHRVWQTIEAYIVNHPDVITASRGDDEDKLRSQIRTAFGDQVVMKVMPKLRGIETDGRMQSHCLDPIKGILSKQDLGLDEDFDIACRAGRGVFMWSSAQYLIRDTAARSGEAAHADG